MAHFQFYLCTFLSRLAKICKVKEKTFIKIYALHAKANQVELDVCFFGFKKYIFFYLS